MNASNSYQCHKISCIRREIILKDTSENDSKDRKYMNDQMKAHFEYLDEHGISVYGNFSQILHDYGLQSSVERKILQTFQEYKKEQDSTNPISLLKKREFRKANLGERNILFNRLAVEYSLEFRNFIVQYIHCHFNYMKKSSQLLQDIQKQFEHVLGQKMKKEIEEAIVPPSPKHENEEEDSNEINVINMDTFFEEDNHEINEFEHMDEVYDSFFMDYQY